MPVETGISKQLADWRSQHISDLNYRVKFRIPADRQVKVRGEVQAVFKLDERGQDLQFDFKGDGAMVHELVANGDQIPVRWERQHVVVDADYLKKGENIVWIRFTTPDQSLNRNDEYLYTLFVPDRASTAFPCFDQPNLKAKFNLELTVPGDWDAVANGPEETAEVNDGTATYMFAQTELLPTYLFAFVAGKFEKVSRTRNNFV